MSVVAINIDAAWNDWARPAYNIPRDADIDLKAIHTIFHDHLSIRKLCNRWINHTIWSKLKNKVRVKWKKMLKKFNRGRSNLVYNIVIGDETWISSYEPESKQQSTVWVFQKEPKPRKAVHSRSTAKQMVACFFDYIGHVALEDQRTINIDSYTIICLPKVINKLRRTNQNRCIILHYDNARCHTAYQIVDFLSSINVTSAFLISNLVSRRCIARCRRTPNSIIHLVRFFSHIHRETPSAPNKCR